jgi:stage II sporulation protein D
VRQARVVGPSGQLLLSGAQLRSRLGLKSTWVRFEQEPLPGAEAMAQGLAGFGGLQVPALPPLLTAPLPAPSPPALQLVAVGRGYGHGIGMSQWGALAMARRGDTYGQILQHYYRGTQVRPYAELALAGLPQPGSWSAGSMALASGSQP